MQTDEEQVEILKNWWRENGRSIIAGVILGIGGLLGYQYWVDSENQSTEEASTYFDKMIEAEAIENNSTATRYAEMLLADYADTDYATMALFMLAQLQVNKGEFEQAGQWLQQVIDTVGNQPLGYLARKRLAELQLQMSQIEQALLTLSADFPPAFSAAVEALKGDVYTQQGKTAEAAEAYHKALNALPGPANRNLIQYKLDDLGLPG